MPGGGGASRARSVDAGAVSIAAWQRICSSALVSPLVADEVRFHACFDICRAARSARHSPTLSPAHPRTRSACAAAEGATRSGACPRARAPRAGQGSYRGSTARADRCSAPALSRGCTSYKSDAIVTARLSVRHPRLETVLLCLPGHSLGSWRSFHETPRVAALSAPFAQARSEEWERFSRSSSS